jgi:hypothetical protein
VGPVVSGQGIFESATWAGRDLPTGIKPLGQIVRLSDSATWGEVTVRPLAKVSLIIVVGGCMQVQTPVERILEHPITASVEIDQSHEWVVACLHDAIRSGPVYEAGVPMITFQEPMPEVSVLSRPGLITDITVQYYQSSDRGRAALYRIAGASPVRVDLYWPWGPDAEGAGARQQVRRSPHQWLARCVDEGPRASTTLAPSSS